MEDFIGKYDGNQIDSRLDKVKRVDDMNHVSAYCFNLHAIMPIFVKNMIYG